MCVQQDRCGRGVLVLWAMGLAAGLLGGCAALAPAPSSTANDAAFLASHGMAYWLIERSEPRPLRIHHLRIDLAHEGIALRSPVAPDPDGPGPAEAVLQPPPDFAGGADVLAVVNCSPWAGLPDAQGRRSSHWHVGMPVDIGGLAVSEGQLRSERVDWQPEFWIDADGEAHTGAPEDLARVRSAVAGFGWLVRQGRPGGGDDALHPRTAVGLDASRRWCHLVVVDGRQGGYSEGMTTRELAAHLRDIGCHDAINLDGGGSSVMLLRGSDGKLRLMNSPSTRRDGQPVLRPLPNALVVRSAER